MLAVRGVCVWAIAGHVRTDYRQGCGSLECGAPWRDGQNLQRSDRFQPRDPHERRGCLHGADYNQPFFGGIRGGERSNFAPTIPQESIQEFQVVASGYSAEFGRSSGGLVNVVTKSGTNVSSGSGFYVNRHRDLANNNVFGQKAAPTQQQWGGSFGAALKRDKAFIFGAYEQQRVNIPRAVLFDNLQGFSPTSATQEAFDLY